MRHIKMARSVGMAAVIVLVLSGCRGLGGTPVPVTAQEAAKLAIAQESRFGGLAPRDGSLIGQAAWYDVQASGDGWQVTIRMGWGDCPAGCISEHRWIYAVGHDGSVRLTSEDGETLPGAPGIRGIATAGPVCPVITDPPNPACADRPVVGAVLTVTDPSGSEVARMTTGSDGRFAVALAPGAYRIVPQPVAGLLGTASPVEIQVAAEGPLTDLVVSYDTGIR